MTGWLHGYGQRPRQPAALPPVPSDQEPATAIRCPVCQSRAIKIRSSEGSITHLVCTVEACRHSWRTTLVLERALVIRGR